MLEYSELYPIQNGHRMMQSLDGMWKFQFDPEEIGEKSGWENGLPAPVSMPVPSSFADFLQTIKSETIVVISGMKQNFTFRQNGAIKKSGYVLEALHIVGQSIVMEWRSQAMKVDFCRCWLTFQQWQNQGKSIRLL